jgi:hypothetical protein
MPLASAAQPALPASGRTNVGPKTAVREAARDANHQGYIQGARITALLR